MLVGWFWKLRPLPTGLFLRLTRVERVPVHGFSLSDARGGHSSLTSTFGDGAATHGLSGATSGPYHRQPLHVLPARYGRERGQPLLSAFTISFPSSFCQIITMRGVYPLGAANHHQPGRFGFRVVHRNVAEPPHTANGSWLVFVLIISVVRRR